MKAREVQQFRSARWTNRWARVVARQQGHVLYELYETRPKRSMELPPERIGTLFRASDEWFAAHYPPGFIAAASGIEARRAATPKSGVVHESPVGEAETP